MGLLLDLDLVLVLLADLWLDLLQDLLSWHFFLLSLLLDLLLWHWRDLLFLNDLLLLRELLHLLLGLEDIDYHSKLNLRPAFLILLDHRLHFLLHFLLDL